MARHVTERKLRALAKAHWAANGILTAGTGDTSTVNLLRTIAAALRPQGINLYVRTASLKLFGEMDNWCEYVLTTNHKRPNPKDWNRYVRLAELVNHDELGHLVAETNNPPTEHLLIAINAGLLTLDQIPSTDRAKVAEALSPQD